MAPGAGIVKFVTTITSTVQAFDQHAYKVALAGTLGVSFGADDIELSLETPLETGGSSVGSGVLRRENPFKQSQRSRHRGGGGNNVPRAGSLRPGELQLQTVGEWEDGISVSSISSSHPSDAPGPGSKESFAGGMNLPAV